MILLSIVIILVIFKYYSKMLYESRRKVKLTAFRASKGNAGDREVIVQEYAQAPGPTPWPILGSLNILGQYDVPFVGLTELAKTYGDIYAITLGSTRCLVVNNLELIREVLNQNGKFFGGRPDFLRFHTLFGGDRSNCKCYFFLFISYSLI